MKSSPISFVLLFVLCMAVLSASKGYSQCAPDVTPPTFSNCNDRNATVDGSCQVALPDYTTLVGASDICDASLTLVQTPTPGTIASGAGTVVPVQVVATDDAFNKATCNFNVTLRDFTAPSLTCPGSQTEFLNGSCQLSLPDYTGSAIVSDNCDVSPSVSQSPVAGTTISGHGTAITVTLTATDASLNTSTCTFSFTASDSTSPVATTQNITRSLTAGSVSITPADVNNASSDNCGTVNLVSVVPSSFTCIDIGANIVTLTINDGNGNTDTETATVTIDDLIDGFCSLPVEWVYFHATQISTKVQLDWTTASETNNKGFEIQRMIRTDNWETIGFVDGNGTTTVNTSYKFIDEHPYLGENTYRLKQVDQNGNNTFSETRQVQVEISDNRLMFKTYPNPSEGGVYIELENLRDQQEVVITDIVGNVLHQRNVTERVSYLDISSLPTGIYFVKMRSGQEETVQKILKH